MFKKLARIALLLIVATTMAVSADNFEAGAQSLSLPTHDSLPPGPLVTSTTGTYQVSDQYTAGSLSIWAEDGLTQADEEDVFHTSLTYTGDGSNDFEMRMGEGGQFYSIISPLGELIGRQHTYSTSFSRWNDAVLESVVTNTNDPRITGGTANLSLNKNPDMNQGGTYIRDGLVDPFYSPHLRFEQPSDTETRSIIWTPPSALPTTYQSGILYDQRTRNMGDGVMEITQLITNFGPDALENRQSIPWASFSGRAMDSFRYRDPDTGAIVTVDDVSWTTNIVNLAEMGGWLAIVDDDHPDELGMALIVGGEPYAYGGSEPIWRSSDMRFGDLNRNQWPDDTEYIVTARRAVNLYEDNTVFFRYYVAFGTAADLFAIGDKYAQDADFGMVAYGESNSPLTNICETPERYTTQSCAETDAIGHLYDYQVPGSKPVFVLQNTTTGEYIYSPDPYAISRISSDDPGRFYDGTTEYVEMLGWAISDDVIALESTLYSSSTVLGMAGGNFDELDGFLFRTAENPQLALTKTVASTDPPMLAEPGDIVTYEFLIENSGNVTMTELAISDNLLGGIVCDSTTNPALTSISPGNTLTCQADYAITQADIDTGFVENSAVVSGQDSNGQTITDVSDPGDGSGNATIVTISVDDSEPNDADSDGDGSSDHDAPSSDPMTFDGVTVTGRVFVDVQRDTDIDTVDTDDVSGVVVELKTAGVDGSLGTSDDMVVDTAVTASPFTFTDVLPGDYLVDVDESTLPVGYVFTGTGADVIVVESGDATRSDEYAHFGVNTVLVTGTIFYDNGNPIANAEVTLTGADGSQLTVRTDDDGNYVFEGTVEAPIEVGDFTVTTVVAGVVKTVSGSIAIEGATMAPEIEVASPIPPTLAFTGSNQARTFTLTATLAIFFGLAISGWTRRREHGHD